MPTNANRQEWVCRVCGLVVQEVPAADAATLAKVLNRAECPRCGHLQRLDQDATTPPRASVAEVDSDREDDPRRAHSHGRGANGGDPRRQRPV